MTNKTICIYHSGNLSNDQLVLLRDQLEILFSNCIIQTYYLNHYNEDIIHIVCT